LSLARTKRTRPRLDALIKGLEAGMTRRAACAYGGFHHTQLYRWMRTSAPLRTAVEKAEGRAEATYLAQIARAATNGTWQAAAWWLERRLPSEFGQRARLDVHVELEAEVRRLALEAGVDYETALAEAERVLKGGSG
jgi:hypothetical protein